MLAPSNLNRLDHIVYLYEFEAHLESRNRFATADPARMGFGIWGTRFMFRNG